MAKKNDVKVMSKEERMQRVKELKIELVKAQTGAQKSNAKTKEIKKALARILTFNMAEKTQLRSK